MMKKLFQVGFVYSCLACSSAVAEPVPLAEVAVDPGDFYAKALLDYTAIKKVSLAEALKLIDEDGAILIDLRLKDAFDKQRLKGAVRFPLEVFTEDKLTALVPNKDTTIILYDDYTIMPTKRVALSTFAGPALKQLDYKNVVLLNPLWQEFGTNALYSDFIPYEGTHTRKMGQPAPQQQHASQPAAPKKAKRAQVNTIKQHAKPIAKHMVPDIPYDSMFTPELGGEKEYLEETVSELQRQGKTNREIKDILSQETIEE